MANRDQTWGSGGARGAGRGRRDERGRDERWRGEEPRAFGDDRRHAGGEPWRGEARYGARYDQERVGYGGQEYGLEGGRDHRDASERDRGGQDQERETWRPGDGEPYGDLELNPRNRGVQEFGPPADYAYHPHAGHEFDPDYLHWRDEQLRGHDRDYREWRHSQQQRYDDDYRRFRSERRESFGRTFSDWRSQRSAVGGVPDTGIAPGVSSSGAKTGMPTGSLAQESSKPSGMIEPPHAINASPGAGQSGGGASGGGSSGGGQPGGDSSPEFGKAPPAVQATSGGWDGRGAPEDQLRKDEDKDKDKT